MACDIDPDLPKVGIPRLNKAAYERNFGAAKGCIEDLQARVEALEAGGGGAGVVTFEGRTGVVVSQSGDYDAAEISSLGPLATPTLAASQTLLADEAGRSQFQNNLGQVVETGTFVINGLLNSKITGVRGHYHTTVKLENPITPAVVELPSPNGAEFAGLAPGFFCYLRAASGAQPATINALVTDTLRHANGYGEPITVGDEDTIFLGYSRATSIGQVYELHRESDIWVLYGPSRVIETDNLTFNAVNAPATIDGRVLSDADQNKQFRLTGQLPIDMPGSASVGLTVLLINRSGGNVSLIGTGGVNVTGDTTLGDNNFATFTKDSVNTALAKVTG